MADTIIAHFQHSVYFFLLYPQGKDSLFSEKIKKIKDTFDFSYLFPAISKILFQQVHFKAVSRMFLSPIPVQAYHLINGETHSTT